MAQGMQDLLGRLYLSVSESPGFSRGEYVKGKWLLHIYDSHFLGGKIATFGTEICENFLLFFLADACFCILISKERSGGKGRKEQ